MADPFPDPLRLREIKYGSKANPKDQLALAHRLIEAGRPAEALDLFLIAGDESGVTAMRAHALAEGRLVLLNMLRRAGRKVSAAEWSQAGAAARAKGRLREAYRCYLEAGDEEALASLEQDLPGYEIFTPQGK